MAEERQVIGCHTVESWKELIKEGTDHNKLVVVDFTASWCGPCRVMAPILADIAKKMPHVMFLKVDVDELSVTYLIEAEEHLNPIISSARFSLLDNTVATEWEVEAMPTFIFLKEGKLVDKIVGANKDDLHSKVAKHAAAVPASA